MYQIEILTAPSPFYGEFHANQESEIRFALSRILDLLPSRF